MTNAMNRTPGKWEVKMVKNSSWGFEEADIISIDEDGKWYGIAEKMCPVDATYIVRAVNCHERLLLWAKGMLESADENNWDDPDNELSELRKVIAEAEGREDEENAGEVGVYKEK